jgi:hypothetical protein
LADRHAHRLGQRCRKGQRRVGDHESLPPPPAAAQ